MSKSSNLSEGLSLLEVVIALALVATLVVSVVGLLPRGLEVSRKAAMHTSAAALAQAKMEDMLSRAYGDIAVGTVEARAPVVSDTSDPLSHFDRQVTVEYVDTNTLAAISTDAGLKRVDVTVFYPTSRGENSLVIRTLISDR